MTETLTHEDGSIVVISAGALNLHVSATSPHAPTAAPISLTLAEVERLIKSLGRMSAQIRGASARANV